MIEIEKINIFFVLYIVIVVVVPAIVAAIPVLLLYWDDLRAAKFREYILRSYDGPTVDVEGSKGKDCRAGKKVSKLL